MDRRQFIKAGLSLTTLAAVGGGSTFALAGEESA